MNIAREAGAWKISAPHPSSDPRFQMPQKDFSDNRTENQKSLGIHKQKKTPPCLDPWFFLQLHS